MSIHSNSSLVPEVLPGLSHRTLAGRRHGLRDLEVWSQCLEPGAATPPHRHDCEEVVVILEGEGSLEMDGRAQRFAAGDTVIVPRNQLHQIFNTGGTPMRLFAILGMTPVQVELPDGTPLPLPWNQE